MNRIVRYDTGYVTHPGNCRTVNQDNLLLRRGAVDGQDFLLLAVADGMGGMARGEEASGCAVALLDSWWNTELPALLSAGGPDWPGLENSLAVAIERINAAVRQAVTDKGEPGGTTLVLAFVYGADYRLLHVGDSRAYLLGAGAPRPLTRDHTWCAHEIAQGRLTPAQAAVHPMRHMLTSTLGVRPSYELDLARGQLGPGSALLLCSDGFYQEAEAALASCDLTRPAQTVLDGLLAGALRGEAADNLTALLVRPFPARR